MSFGHIAILCDKTSVMQKFLIEMTLTYEGGHTVLMIDQKGVGRNSWGNLKEFRLQMCQTVLTTNLIMTKRNGFANFMKEVQAVSTESYDWSLAKCVQAC